MSNQIFLCKQYIFGWQILRIFKKNEFFKTMYAFLFLRRPFSIVMRKDLSTN